MCRVSRQHFRHIEIAFDSATAFPLDPIKTIFIFITTSINASFNVSLNDHIPWPLCSSTRKSIRNIGWYVQKTYALSMFSFGFIWIAYRIEARQTKNHMRYFTILGDIEKWPRELVFSLYGERIAIAGWISLIKTDKFHFGPTTCAKVPVKSRINFKYLPRIYTAHIDVFVEILFSSHQYKC